jgi:hypothetical protein
MANRRVKAVCSATRNYPPPRVIIPPDTQGRVFDDDLGPGNIVFDRNLTPILTWHERCPVGRGWRSGWLLIYDTDGTGNLDGYIVGFSLGDIDAASKPVGCSCVAPRPSSADPGPAHTCNVPRLPVRLSHY